MTPTPAPTTTTTGRWGRAERLRELYWMLAAMGTVGLLGVIPVLFNPRFYWADDTQAGAYPIWVQIGRHVQEGRLPFFEPAQWMSGNYVAEGQWGTFNPVIWLTGLVAANVDNGMLFTTVLKIGWLMLAAGGFYLLARSYGASRVWAFAAGVLAPNTGFVTYAFSTSWVTSLFVWALLPWAWWALRRVMLRRANPIGAFVAGYVLITIGYVHGTLLLVVAILGLILEGALLRQWRGTIRMVVTSALLGLVAFAVYIPGVLTAPVTTRFDEVINSNFMSPDLSGLAASAIPTAQPWLQGFWGMPPQAPLLYIAWLLPLVVLVSLGRAVPVLRQCVAPLFVLAVSAFFTFGPSDLGPLRFPARLYPYVAAMLLVLLAVLLSRAAVRPARAHGRAVVVLTAIGFVLAWSEAPGSWRGIAAGAVLSGAGVLVVLALWRRRGDVRLAAALAAITAAVVGMQHYSMPDAILPDFGLPARQSDYAGVLDGVPGQTLVVGQPLWLPETVGGESRWRSTLYANAWYLTDAPVVNTYSAIAHEAFNRDLCADAHGVVCWELAERLWSPDASTGVPLADLLAIDAVQLLARTGEGLDPVSDPYTYLDVPDGWHEVRRTEAYALWARDVPLDQGAGGIVWVSEGTEVSDVQVTGREVSFRVETTLPTGGQVAFSRLDWPGYAFTNATQGPSVRGHLLTADLTADAAGQTVTVRFTPPGWYAGVGAIGVAVIGVLGWAVVAAVTKGRLRATHATDGDTPQASTPASAP